MEKASQITLPTSISLADIVGLLFICPILNWVIRINKFYLTCLRFCESRVGLISAITSTTHDHDDRSSRIFNEDTKKSVRRSKTTGGIIMLSRQDVEEVMGRVGISCNREGDEQLKDCMGRDDLSSLFEEEEPSLDEVNEAFWVFDENRDGFIDAEELQRVLSRLGLQEVATVEACEQMIGVFDDNRDGRIDFDEFVKIMDSSFC